MTDNQPETPVVPGAGIDLAGIGKAMQAIPEPAWQRLVETACATVEKVLAPITETTHGIGRLIKAKFDSMLDAEQVMVAESLTRAEDKARNSGQAMKAPRPQIIMLVIENSSRETDGGIRELWSNLLAQEIITDDVHPEIARILSRISSEDAQLLAEISDQKSSNVSKLFSVAVKVALSSLVFGDLTVINSKPKTFNHAHLQNLGLIQRNEGNWELTVFGEGFIKAVTDPSLTIE